ncbi:MAG: HAD-IIIA family hydrolase [Alphaproteobacteria bacterium]|nr:HAD-IIIA family hydrolase [Alphaproteobacteria bacterium]
MVDAGDGKLACVFLDRDGVLNRPILANGRSYAPRELDDFELLPGVAEAVDELKSLEYLAIVVTNQKDLGHGLISAETLDEMHRRLRAAVAVDDLLVCSCIDECWCYKPNPGMLSESAETWDIDLGSSFIVGDTWRDVGAGQAAGCRTILIDGWEYEDQYKLAPDFTAPDLPAAVDLIRQLTGGQSKKRGR